MNKKITFANLLDKIAEETGASKKLIHDLLIETVNLTREGLNRDGYANLSGLGRFRLKWHKARSGRNPQTGEKIEIPGHSTVNFKAEANLREYINRKYSHLQSEIIEGEIEQVGDEPAVTSIKPEDTPSPPVSITPPVKQEKEEEKKRFARWPWLVIPLLIIILAYIFWPSQKVSETDIIEPVVSEKVDKDVPIPPEETEQPEIKPVIEDIKYETPGGQHTVKPGEKLWTISLDFYNQGDLWPNIYRMNLNEIKNPDLLSIGNEIRIPSLQGKPGNLTQKDIEDIAEGFIEVYLAYKESDKGKALYYLWVVNKWNINEIIDKYSDRIDETDLKLVDKIEGYPHIK
jgi:nucleoid DNA-binding protein